MSSGDESRVALYTARPEAYPDLDAEVLSGAALLASAGAADLSKAKAKLLDSAKIIVIDFEGFTDYSPFSFLMGALKRLCSGEVRAIAGVGIGDVPVEKFTSEEAERLAVMEARRDKRLCFMLNMHELESWLQTLYQQS